MTLAIFLNFTSWSSKTVCYILCVFRSCFNRSFRAWSIIGAYTATFKFIKPSTNGCFRQKTCALMLYLLFLGLDYILFCQKARFNQNMNISLSILFTKTKVVSLTWLQFIKKLLKCHGNLTLIF